MVKIYISFPHELALQGPDLGFNPKATVLLVDGEKVEYWPIYSADHCVVATRSNADVIILPVVRGWLRKKGWEGVAIYAKRLRRDGMGLFHVDVDIEGPSGDRERLSMLVDTGATYSAVPPAIAKRLRLRILREETFQVAGGARLTRPLAEVRVHVNDREGPTVAIVMDGPTFLGAHALEGLGLGVDPEQKCLVPVEPVIGIIAQGVRRA